MGIKERRTKILLALFLLSDVQFKEASLDTRFQNLFDLSINQKTKGTLASLIKEGSLVKIETSLTAVPLQNQSDPVDETDKKFYGLTDKGFHELCLQFPALRFLKDKWDGKWRILSYEIPEKKRDLRDKLRREVAGWGLGPWHRSFWLTPHPITDNLKDLVSQKEEEKFIQAFESEHVFGNKDILIEKVWGKSALDKRYRELFKIWHEILSKELDKAEKYRLVINQYIPILRADPGLPSELIGKSWIGFEAFQIYKEIRSILLT